MLPASVRSIPRVDAGQTSIIDASEIEAIASFIEEGNTSAMRTWLAVRYGHAIITRQTPQTEEHLRIIMRHVEGVVLGPSVSLPASAVRELWVRIGRRKTEKLDSIARSGEWHEYFGAHLQAWRMRLELLLTKAVWPRAAVRMAGIITYINDDHT